MLGNFRTVTLSAQNMHARPGGQSNFVRVQVGIDSDELHQAKWHEKSARPTLFENLDAAS